MVPLNLYRSLPKLGYPTGVAQDPGLGRKKSGKDNCKNRSLAKRRLKVA